MRTIGLLFLLGNVVWFAACGGNGGGSSSSVTSIQVSCSPSTVSSGQTSTCTATVFGTGNFNSNVTWSTSAGTISSSGVLTAPTVSSSTSVTVTATSTQNTGVAGSATVTVVPTTSAVNQVPLIVDSGPNNIGTINEAFVTVTICVPGTNTCQNIDHIQVDTGSEGLRLLSSASGGPLSLNLPQETDGSGNQLAECLVFADGYVWGTVATADIVLAGEKSPSTPVQIIIPPSASPAVPSSCSSQNPPGGAGNEGGSVMDLGANGILGVGPFPYDCGTACTPGFQTQDFYYGCPSNGCFAENISLSQQIINPAFGFTSTGDDNGVLIQLPSVPNGGSPNPTGTMTFGINTQSNNNLSLAANDYLLNDQGNFSTVFNNNTYSSSFLDSGSNGLFFPDSSIPTCPSPNNVWYCPNNSPDDLSASNYGTNMSPPGVTTNFAVEDATTLFNTNNTAFSTLAGPLPQSLNSFDFGLSFFFGKNVFTAIQGQPTNGGPTGPYVAY